MNQSEAWLITVLGIAVVFFGLVLCIAFINFFNLLAKKISWDGNHGAVPPPAVAPAPEPIGGPSEPAAPVSPEVLAVITAAIEIERRLYQGRPGQRLTIARGRNQE